jgi:glycine amidinotransferase
VAGQRDGVQPDANVIVKSWNEWDPLKRVILGRADFCCIPAPEPAYDFEVPDDYGMHGMYGPRPQAMVEAANAQLDAYAELLEGRGITVDRPTPIQWNRATGTPDWSCETQTGCMPPRDVLLTIGREILEATMSYRSRWFEYLAYRSLLNRYFEEDRGFRWETAPKPRLTDASYRRDYLSDDVSEEQRQQWVDDRIFVTTEAEPLFDAADVCRMGKDLFVQHGFTTNLKGMEWLQRHYPDHRVHAVNFPGDQHPIHIDGTFVPLRPGLVISNPVRQLPEEQKEIFKKNGWEIVIAAKPAHEQSPPLCYSSVWLSMNCLLLDPKTVCCEASEVYQQEQFDKLGFDVVPVPFRDVYAFGGGLHCSTADVYREGTCEDYFPAQVPGF